MVEDFVSGTDDARTGAGHEARDAYDHDLVRRRYGTDRGARAGRSQWLLPLVVALVILGGAIGLNAAMTAGPSVAVEHVGYTVEDSSTVQVRFVVIAEPGTEVVCTLRAVNRDFTEVGVREVRIGPVTARRTSAEETITTAELAYSGHAESCSAA